MDSILDDPSNRISQYVSASNRSSDEKPLTIDVLTRSIFSCFLYREPTEDNLATDAYHRDDEVFNAVALMNSIHDLALSQWNGAKAAGANDENPAAFGPE